MMRLLVLVALAVVLWLFLEAGWARLKRMKPPDVTLVRCSGCGVHVPRGRVVAGRCERCRLPERTQRT